MEGLIVMAIFAWVIGKILGGKAKQQKRGQSQAQPGQTGQPRPRNWDDMLEQQRARAEIYRRAQAEQGSYPAQPQAQAQANRTPAQAQPQAQAQANRTPAQAQAQAQAQARAQWERARPWSPPPAEGKRQRPASLPSQAERQRPLPSAAIGSGRQRAGIDLHQTAAPMAAQAQAHAAAPATTGNGLPHLGFSQDDLVRGLVMREILGPCKARQRFQ